MCVKRIRKEEQAEALGRKAAAVREQQSHFSTPFFFSPLFLLFTVLPLIHSDAAHIYLYTRVKIHSKTNFIQYFFQNR